jgi:hypothetical protein
MRVALVRIAVPFVVLSGVLAGTLAAQEPRLAGRLPEGPRLQIDSLLGAARTERLPVEPLVDRALEGVVKGAPADRVVGAVARLLDELRSARTAFGPAASVAELTAGASALRAGAPPGDLARLRTMRAGQPLTVPAAVLADLVSAGVPVDTAVTAVMALAESAPDAEYVAFRRHVQRDIALGAAPAAALAVRLRAAIAVSDGAVGGETGAPLPRKRKP